MTVPADVAQWMVVELDRRKYLYQAAISYEIQSRFGDQFVYVNANGNLAIDRRVLREFRGLTEPNVVWERAGRLWRYRAGYDPPGQRGVA